MRTLWADVRVALRMLARKPAFTAAALITLALGIGAQTAVFGLVRAVAFEPWPGLPEPARIVWLFQTAKELDGERDAVSLPDFEDWSKASTLQATAGIGNGAFNLGGGATEPDRVTGFYATPSVFDVLGVHPSLGRGFTAGEDHAIVISERLWHARWKGDPSILGSTVTVDGATHTVVGVIPAAADFPMRTDVWVPLVVDPRERADRGKKRMAAIARLAPGVALPAAQAELDAIAARAAQLYPETNAGWGVRLTPVPELFLGRTRPALAMLVAAAAFILLIVCANVAHLLLARASERRRELAIRAAMGASRRRLVGQLLTEAAVLAVLGGVLGAAVAAGALDLITAAIPDGMQRRITGLSQLSLDRTALLVNALVAAAAGLLTGALPALRASRIDLHAAMQDGGAAGPSLRRGRAAGVLVAAQIALAVALVAGAAASLRTFARLRAAPSGFDEDRVLTAELPVVDEEPAARQARAARLLEAVSGIPGVELAALTDNLPTTNGGPTFTVEGRPAPPAEEQPWARHAFVSPGYLRALGVPLLAGRGLETEGGADPVVVISASIAESVFHGEDPLGRRLSIDGGPPRRIVGVVGNTRSFFGRSSSAGALYEPYTQGGAEGTFVVLRTAADPSQLVRPLREAVRRVDSLQPVVAVVPLEELVAGRRAPARLFAGLLGVLGALALVLSAVGVYGLAALAATARMREMGVRIALGARPGQLRSLILRRALVPAIAGVTVGVALAAMLGRVLAAAFEGGGGIDLLAVAAAGLILGGVALLAGLLPAHRAGRADPLVALRAE